MCLGSRFSRRHILFKMTDKDLELRFFICFYVHEMLSSIVKKSDIT